VLNFNMYIYHFPSVNYLLISALIAKWWMSWIQGFGKWDQEDVWLDQEREKKLVTFSLSEPHDLEECRLIRIKALDVMSTILQGSSFPCLKVSGKYYFSSRWYIGAHNWVFFDQANTCHS
jgi:hypothetical protein